MSPNLYCHITSKKPASDVQAVRRPHLKNPTKSLGIRLQWPVTEVRLGAKDDFIASVRMSGNGVEIMNKSTFVLDALFDGLRVNMPTKDFAKVLLSRLAGVCGEDAPGCWVTITRLNNRNEMIEEKSAQY